MFQVKWADGFYITRNGEAFIEGFAGNVDVSQIETLCDMLNAAQQSFAPDAASLSAPDDTTGAFDDSIIGSLP